MRLKINSIKQGVVIDHIRAGQGTKIFNYLGLDKADFTVALIINAQSKKLGKKDMIKVENEINIDFAILGLIDPNITVNIIKDEAICEKIKLELPTTVEEAIKCKNPRCITSTEKHITDIFELVNREKGIYSCQYCDALYTIPNM
ncbi:MAG: aspartate carbamoyltransferase regulatory subunit [Epulopiscium sp.]|nr:aspartate carbamoyltransferase regulatory subunit [Candidatus Epulonipiscium sp.]